MQSRNSVHLAMMFSFGVCCVCFVCVVFFCDLYYKHPQYLCCITLIVDEGICTSSFFVLPNSVFTHCFEWCIG
jgi:hypothetical protein